ncbi:MAG TPA: hypothetical protein VMR34_03210 [Candidatus Saccharimonadales bacterium]|nr:hypothetical protein [Candidatus Saccharimonadales bacterium]
MQIRDKIKKFKPSKKLSSLRFSTGIVVCLLAALIGARLLFGAHAEGPYVSFEAESGTVVSPAVIYKDPTASNGEAVQFGSNSTTSGRVPYDWPFTWDSIWNIPISSGAQYVSAGIIANGIDQESTSGADDYDSVNPTFPVKTLTNAQLANGTTGPAQVYSDPSMTAGGVWDDCAAFLGTDNMTVYQGQTLQLTAGGNPGFGGQADSTQPPVTLESAGTAGCHGGSGLSGLGGTLTNADFSSSSPIQHALKIAIDCNESCSDKGSGYTWPATSADYQYNVSGTANYYGGTNTNVHMGSLLALPPSINPSSFSNAIVQKLATATQDYGAYIVDNTANGSLMHESFITNYNANSYLLSLGTSNSQIIQLIEDLEVVNNNTSSTPGGGAIGSSRYAPYAPAFNDGTDAPPSVTVISP